MKIKVLRCTDERAYYPCIGKEYEVIREVPYGYIILVSLAGQEDKIVIVKRDAEIID